MSDGTTNFPDIPARAARGRVLAPKQRAILFQKKIRGRRVYLSTVPAAVLGRKSAASHWRDAISLPQTLPSFRRPTLPPRGQLSTNTFIFVSLIQNKSAPPAGQTLHVSEIENQMARASDLRSIKHKAKRLQFSGMIYVGGFQQKTQSQHLTFNLVVLKKKENLVYFKQF